MAGLGLLAIFLMGLLIGADTSQMQAVMQQIDDIMEYVGMPDVEQADKDQEIADRLNSFFKAGLIQLFTGDIWNGNGYVASIRDPKDKPNTGHVYIYNQTGSMSNRILYFEVVSYPYYDMNSLPDGLVRELYHNYEDFTALPEPLVTYYRYKDEEVPWTGDQTSLSEFMGRMLLLSKLRHVTSRNPVDLAEQWSNYLDRFSFDFNDLDYIYRNFPIFLENPWLWLQSGSSLNTLMELIGSGVMLSDFAYVSGDNPIYNFLSSVWGAEQLNSLWEAAFNQTNGWQLVPYANGTFAPLPYLVTYTHVLDEMGLLDPFGEAGSEIYGAYSNWSLNLNGSNSLYSYEFILSSIFDSLTNSTLISSCSDASDWNVTGNNVTLSTDGYSIIVSVMGNHSNTTTLSHNLTQPLNLTGYNSLLLWFNMNATRGNFTTLKIVLRDQEGDWKEYSTWAYNTSQRWERLTLDLDEPDSQSGSFGSLANITITATPNQILNYSFSIDDVRVNSRILCECLWDTDWSYQLLNGTGNLNITVYGFPYVYDYPYSLGLEWNLTQSNGSAKYVYNPRGVWSLDPEGFLTFMLYGFGDEQNTTLTVCLCTDQNNFLNYSLGKVDWYGWRKVSVPIKLMNKSGSANLSSVDYLEFKLGDMSNGTGTLVVSDIRTEPAGWVKVEFVVPDSVLIGSGGGGPWLAGWNYRKSHTINGSTAGAQTNYQTRITVHYGSGTDSGEDVYCNSKCRTDFGDVRFTKSDGTIPLDYWLENKTDGDKATFWVELDSIPASPDTVNIYVYYGKSDASTASNGTNTFLLFDDFNNVTITLEDDFEDGNIGGWTTGGSANWFASTRDKHGGSYSAESGDIGDSQQTYIQRDVNLPNGGTITYWWKVSSQSQKDWLRFYINGTKKAEISGTSGTWKRVTFALLPGTSTIKWQYEKDSSNSSGYDCGWIDDIVVKGGDGAIYSWNKTGSANWLNGMAYEGYSGYQGGKITSNQYT